MTSTLFESNILSKTHQRGWDRGGHAVCRYDTIGLMKALGVLLAAAACWPAVAQNTSDDPVTVSADHPRLLLRPQRLRLLRRERERASMRWQQFSAFVTGN